MKSLFGFCVLLTLCVASSTWGDNPETDARTFFQKLSEAAKLRLTIQQEYLANPPLMGAYPTLQSFYSAWSTSGQLNGRDRAQTDVAHFGDGFNKIRSLRMDALHISEPYFLREDVSESGSDDGGVRLMLSSLCAAGVGCFYASSGLLHENPADIKLGLEIGLGIPSVMVFGLWLHSGFMAFLEHLDDRDNARLRKSQNRDREFLAPSFWKALLKLDEEGKLLLPEGQQTENSVELVKAMVRSFEDFPEIKVVNTADQARILLSAKVRDRICEWQLSHL